MKPGSYADLEQRILDQLVRMAAVDKRYAWYAARNYEELGERVQCTPKLFSDMQGKLTARMQQPRETNERPA